MKKSDIKYFIVGLCFIVGFMFSAISSVYVIKNSNQMSNVIALNNKKISELDSLLALDIETQKKIVQTESAIYFYNDKLKPDYVHRIAVAIVNACLKYPNVNYLLLTGLIASESNFIYYAVSKSGALGLVQMLPSTAKGLCLNNKWVYSKKIMFEPEKNILLGTQYFSNLIDNKNGNVELALAAYNGGSSSINYALDKNQQCSEKNVPKLTKETKNYPNTIFKKWNFLRKIFK